MTLRQILAAALAALTFTTHAFANEPDYVLVQRYEYSSESLDGGNSGSGSGGSVLSERIIQSQDGSLEIEYSIPGDFSKVRGNAMWMYPARVAVAPDGSKILLNASELEERNLAWREKANWPPVVCGKWTLPWTAVQISCDPQAVIEEIKGHDMRPGVLEAGTSFALPEYGVELVLSKGEPDERGQVLTATGAINSDYAQRKIAEAKVVAASISGQELTLEQALADAASITTDGEVSVTFIVDKDGLVLMREERYDITVTGQGFGDERRTGRITVFRVPYGDWLNG